MLSGFPLQSFCDYTKRIFTAILHTSITKSWAINILGRRMQLIHCCPVHGTENKFPFCSICNRAEIRNPVCNRSINSSAPQSTPYYQLNNLQHIFFHFSFLSICKPARVRFYSYNLPCLLIAPHPPLSFQFQFAQSRHARAVS